MSEEPLRIVIEIERAGEHYRATRQFSTLSKPRNVSGLKLGPQDTFPIRGQQRSLVEPLDILLAYRGGTKPADFDFFFDERGQFDLGAYLYQDLFQRLGAEERTALDRAERVDLVVVTRDPHLDRLPWVLLVRDDRFVVTGSWTVAVARNVRSLSHTVELPPDPKILIVAPNPKTAEYPDTEAESHVDELEAALRGRNPLLARGGRLIVATTWDELRKGLAGQPDVVYYYGHGEGTEDTARLVFCRTDGGADEIPVAEFTHCLQQEKTQPPLMVYINCCHGDAGGALGVGGQLADLFPAIVTNRTVAFTAQARAQARRFLEQTVLFGAAPHAAVGELYGLIDEAAFTLSNPRWMTPVFYRGYGRWKSTPVRDASWILDPYWREKLDRELQFGVVFTKTSQMLASGQPIGLAFLWYGQDGDGMERFHHRLNVELGPMLPEGVRLLEYRLAWPPEFADPEGNFDPDPSFREMYCRGFEVGDIGNIPARVKRQAGAGARKVLIYVRHRVVTDPRRLQTRFLKAYLSWWDSHLPKLCGAGQFCLLGISYQSADLAQFARVIHERVKAETLPYEHGVCRVLLIDEIDKAPRDFPNDLLHELDQMEFRVLETGEYVRVSSDLRPIVFITSNSERRLPEPFLRRCVYHHIEFDSALLQRILLSHRDDFGGLSDGFIELAVERFLSLRSRGLYKAPSTGELLVWLRVLAAAGNVSEAALREADPSRLPYLGVLLKNRQDLLERE